MMEQRRYAYRTRPYDHQIRGMRRLLGQGYGGALLFEPRTGKTKTTIDWIGACSIRDDVRLWVVVCPRRVMGVWKEQIPEHLGYEEGSLGKRPLIAQVFEWTAPARKQGPPPRMIKSADVMIVLTNYETFAGPSKDRNIKNLERWIRAGKAGMILDESHRIKSPSGRASRAIVRIGTKFHRRAILTGTPTTKSYRMADIYMQWKFLNPERFEKVAPTHRAFKDRYGRWLNMGGYEKYLGPRSENIPEYHRLIALDAMSVTREKCFDMPPVVPRDIVVHLSNETARIYDKVAEQMIAELKSGEITSASTALVKTLRLAQIASGVARVEDGRLVRVGREKLNAVLDLIEDSVEHDEKIVVVARFRADIVSVLNETRRKFKIPTFRLDGTVDPSQTERDLKTFRELDGPGLFVLQPQAGGVGIDLSTAGRLVWMSLTTSWVDYTQCTDRVALNRNCDIVRVLANGTVDQRYVKMLAADTQIGREVLNNPEILRRNAE